MIEPVARVRIELRDIEPRIWRRVDVPVSATFMALHDIIQTVMRWQDAHLFEFVVGDRIYGEPRPDDEAFGRKVFQAKGIRLQTLINRGVEQFLYVYDFGDDWRHDVVIEGVREGAADVDYPAFLDGARRAPPEDVGGAYGFMEFLEAVLDPTHEEHDRMVMWYGGPFDPADIDERHVRAILSMMADRRRGPVMSHRRGGAAIPVDVASAHVARAYRPPPSTAAATAIPLNCLSTTRSPTRLRAATSGRATWCGGRAGSGQGQACLGDPGQVGPACGPAATDRRQDLHERWRAMAVVRGRTGGHRGDRRAAEEPRPGAGTRRTRRAADRWCDPQ